MKFEGMIPHAGFADVLAWFSCECGHSKMDEGDRNVQQLTIALAPRAARREPPGRNRSGKTGGEIAPAHIHFQLPVPPGQSSGRKTAAFLRVARHRADEQARAHAKEMSGNPSVSK